MARLPLPERGQPLDLTYVYQLASTINDLSSAVNSGNALNFTVDSPDSSQKQSVRVSDGKVIGAYVEVATDSDVIAGNTEISGTYSFDFKYPPVVTATVRDRAGTNAGSDAFVVIKKISSSKVDFVVKFRTSGKVTVGVNLIAMGIPNTRS